MKKIIVHTLLIGILLNGCGSQSYFAFNEEIPKNSKFTKIDKYVALLEIEVPDYLKQDRIAVMKNGKIIFLDQKWTEPIEGSLEKELTSYLINRLPSYGVLKYPWQRDIKAQAEISLHINDFIYKNGKVFLQGYYIIKKEDSSYKKIFSLQTESSRDPFEIVKNMKKLYKKLEEEIKRDLL